MSAKSLHTLYIYKYIYVTCITVTLYIQITLDVITLDANSLSMTHPMFSYGRSPFICDVSQQTHLEPANQYKDWKYL